MNIPDERHRELREQLGAYVLEQLDDTERAEVDAHLADCSECRAEADDLLPLALPLSAADPSAVDPSFVDPSFVDVDAMAADTAPPDTHGFAAILDRIRAEEEAGTAEAGTADGEDPPARPALDPPTVHTRPALDPPTVYTRPALDPPTIVTAPVSHLPAATPGPAAPGPERGSNVRPLRRRPRASTLRLAAAAVVIAVAGIGIGTAVAPGSSSGPVESVGVQALRPGIDAEAGVVPHTWGVEVKLTATGFDAGQTYRAAVLDAAGRPVGAGEFVGTGGDEMECNLNSSVLRDRATGFVVTDAAGNPVLTSRFSA